LGLIGHATHGASDLRLTKENERERSFRRLDVERRINHLLGEIALQPRARAQRQLLQAIHQQAELLLGVILLGVVWTLLLFVDLFAHVLGGWKFSATEVYIERRVWSGMKVSCA